MDLAKIRDKKEDAENYKHHEVRMFNLELYFNLIVW